MGKQGLLALNNSLIFFFLLSSLVNAAGFPVAFFLNKIEVLESYVIFLFFYKGKNAIRKPDEKKNINVFLTC